MWIVCIQLQQLCIHTYWLLDTLIEKTCIVIPRYLSVKTFTIAKWVKLLFLKICYLSGCLHGLNTMHSLNTIQQASDIQQNVSSLMILFPRIAIEPKLNTHEAEEAWTYRYFRIINFFFVCSCIKICSNHVEKTKINEKLFI